MVKAIRVLALWQPLIFVPSRSREESHRAFTKTIEDDFPRVHKEDLHLPSKASTRPSYENDNNIFLEDIRRHAWLRE